MSHIIGHSPEGKGRTVGSYSTDPPRRQDGGHQQDGLFSVNYFCRRIASPGNVTEILAFIPNPNQD